MRHVHSLLVVAVIAVLMLSPGVAFRVAYFVEDMAMWTGNHAVLLEESDGTVSAEEFRHKVQAYAEQTGHDITITVLSPDHEEGHRHFYSTAQESVSSEASFVRGETIVRHPLSDLDVNEARYTYFIAAADPDAAAQFLDWADEQGYSGQILGSLLLQLLLNDTMFTLFLLLLLTPFTAAAAHSITRSRSIGVYRMLGKTACEHAAADMRSARTPLLAAALIIPALTVTALSLYNGLSRSGVFFASLVVLMAIGLLSTTAGYFAGYGVARTAGIIGGIRGAAPTRVLIDGVALIRVFALLVTLGAVGMAAGSTSAVLASERDRAAWAEHTEATYVGIGGGRDWIPLAPELRELDQAGELIFVNPFWHITNEAAEHTIVLVNTAWVQQETDLGPEMLPTAESEVVVVHPGTPRDDTTQAIAEHLRFEAEVGGAGVDNLRSVEGPTGLTAFTYAQGGPAVIEEPVLVILPPGLAPIGDRNLAAAVTGRTILFPSEDIVDAWRSASPVAQQAIIASGPAANGWAETHRDMTARAVGAWISLAMAVGLVTFLVITTTLAYHLVHRRRLHVGHLLGRNPWWDRPGLLIVEALFVLIPVLWLLRQIGTYRAALAINAPSATLTYHGVGTVSPLLIVLVAGFTLAWAATSLAGVRTFTTSGKDFS